jgi:UDP-glucose 4-epimerase
MLPDTYYHGKRILITGGLGFVGSNLAIRLVQSGAEVTIVDSMIPNHGGNLRNIEKIETAVRVNYSDIRDHHSLKYLIRGQEIVFSLAGQVSHIDSMQDPFNDLEINCTSQLSLLENIRKVNPEAKVVFASTRQIYGRPQYLPVDEKHPLHPVDVNGINKISGEYYYKLYNDVYGIRTVSLRLTNSYGPRQDIRNRNLGFVGIFIRQAITGETIRVFGDGLQCRDFNYIDDVVDAFLQAGCDDACVGNSYNLGDHRHYSLIEFLKCLQQFVPLCYEVVPFPSEKKAIDIGDFYSSYELFHSVTGWEPKIALPDGLSQTVRFFQNNLHYYE